MNKQNNDGWTMNSTVTIYIVLIPMKSKKSMLLSYKVITSSYKRSHIILSIEKW